MFWLKFDTERSSIQAWISIEYHVYLNTQKIVPNTKRRLKSMCNVCTYVYYECGSEKWTLLAWENDAFVLVSI